MPQGFRHSSVVVYRFVYCMYFVALSQGFMLDASYYVIRFGTVFPIALPTYKLHTLGVYVGLNHPYKGSMYLYSRYLSLKGVYYNRGTLRPKYILYGYMEP